MPWKIVKKNNQFCVYKEDENGEPVGESLGCHDTEPKAQKQLKALYASEASSAHGEIERRFYAGNIEIRQLDDGIRRISGYAAVFNELSEDMGGWREVIEPDSFSDVLEKDVRSLFNHDSNIILGRTPKTLRLREDENGLRYEVDLPDTQAARDLYESIQRGDITQSSFGFVVSEDVWEHPTEERNFVLRRLKKFKTLFDVSPVTFPAYPTTSAEARSRAAGVSLENDGAAGRLAIAKARLKIMEVSE